MLPLAYALSAFCFSAISDFKNAERCYEAALRLQPKDEAILTHRGIVLYGRDPTRAAADFEEAIDLRADFVWPYFFLAHYYMTAGRYGDCLSMTTRALALPANAKVQARCIEWRAICEAMLGYDPEIVVESFNKALQLEPNNRQIAKNRDVFQSRTSSQSGTFAWEKERGADVLELGRAFEGKLQLATFASN
jgi:tetratricopeptide (TPR) repeat protein